jgi:hypothetical protein
MSFSSAARSASIWLRHTRARIMAPRQQNLAAFWPIIWRRLFIDDWDVKAR